MRRNAGFTLIELLVVVALVGILTTLALPGVRALLQKRSVASAADQLISDFRFARSEALKRSTTVTICRSTNGTSCVGTSGSWSAGWIVFIDFDGNGTVDTGDTIIRVQDSIPTVGSIQHPTNPSSDRHTFRYGPNGLAVSADQTFQISPVGTAVTGSTRLMCISLQGRVSLRAEGAASCS